MSSRRNKPVAEKGRPGPRTYDVQRTGTRHSVRITETASSQAAASAPIVLADNPLTQSQLDELVVLEFAAEEANPAVQHSEPQPDSELEQLCVQLEEEIQDSADTYTVPRKSGEGQNEMFREWSNKWGQLFLVEIYGDYDSPDSRPCLCVVPTGERFRYADCVTSVQYCSLCVCRAHMGSITHRISSWNGHTWTRNTLKSLQQIIEAGRHLGPCTQSEPKPLLLGDITRFHEVSVTYCACDTSQDECIQLLRTSLMPCSTKYPVSAFTFHALQLHDLLAYDAKLSSSRYHAVLQRQNNNIAPKNHQSCLRELLHIGHEWTYLQALKCAGQHLFSPQDLGALVLHCPACPRLNSNCKQSDIVVGQE
ncbi:hypothetical protein RSAG8_08175, partial [Rhizoctonia solani AG-8 WAC10335]